MTRSGQDKVQREIEELLDKLDNYVPEERLASKVRNRSRRSQSGEPGVQRAWTRLTRVTLGQLMLGGLALIILAFFLRDPLGAAAGPLMIAGLVVAAAAFLLSAFSGGASRTMTGSRHVEKRWRGQVIEYSEPSAIDRMRQWLRSRRSK